MSRYRTHYDVIVMHNGCRDADISSGTSRVNDTVADALHVIRNFVICISDYRKHVCVTTQRNINFIIFH